MLVKVHNNNIHPYKEDFRGRTIYIESNSYVEMDEDEADYFIQAFVFPKKDSQGRPDPLFFKKLKIEKPKVEAKADDFLICHANGQKLASKDELSNVLASFSHLLAGKDDEGESEVLRKKNKELLRSNKEMKSRLDLIEEKLGIGASTHAESL